MDDRERQAEIQSDRNNSGWRCISTKEVEWNKSKTRWQEELAKFRKQTKWDKEYKLKQMNTNVCKLIQK